MKGRLAILVILAGCAAKEPEPLVVLSPCPVVPGELLDAGDLPDGLPKDDGDAVLALHRAWADARAALREIRDLAGACRN